jgi:cytochrome c peroxidase
VRSLPHPPNTNVKEDCSPTDAAPAAAKRGFEIFTVKAGCKACHLPPTFDKKDLEEVDSGGKFKVPSLRSVSRTAPYFHDGRFATLEQAVRFMWQYQQKAGTTEKLSDQDISDLVEYMKIL